MNNTKNKKNIRKVLKSIKWENIFCLISIILDFVCIIKHIQLNGFYEMLGFELIIYFGFTFLLRYIIKDIRVNTKEWLCLFYE